MNIKGESHRLEHKQRKLREELSRPENKQNYEKIRRLQESISRHKSIAIGLKKKRRWTKYVKHNKR